MSYTCNYAGNQVVSPDDVEFYHQVRKFYQAVIQYKCSGRKNAIKIFEATVKDSSEIRCFRQYEQIVQVSKYELDNTLKDIVKVIFVNNFLKESSKIISNTFDEDWNKAKLVMVLVETAAISDSIRPLCTAYHELEGDSPLIPAAQQAVNKIDNQLNIESVPLLSV